MRLTVAFLSAMRERRASRCLGSWDAQAQEIGRNRSLDCDVAYSCLINEKKAHRSVKDTEI